MALTRIEGAGEASIFKGDPRLPSNSIDDWYQGILTYTGKAEKRPYLYGSDAGLCARRNVLLEHNTWVPGAKGATQMAYMAMGVGLEDMLAQGLNDKGRLIVQSQRLPLFPQFKISGKIDLVVFDHQDELALIEVKTCGKLPLEPKPTHLAQIQLYAAVSGIQRCWLTYISRNVMEDFGGGLAVRSFFVDCSPETLLGRLMTASLSFLASERGALPPVPATFRKHTECHYCEFRDLFCYSLRPGLGGGFPTSPLPELSPSELIVLTDKAGVLSKEISSDTPRRKKEFLKELLNGKLTPENKRKLKVLWDSSSM